jgi:chemotaxis protein MotA
LKDHHAVAFLCDTLRMAVTGGVDVMEIDSMMEIDLEVHHSESAQPVAGLTTMADALPGLGIVAAVLGVCITMGSLGGPKEEIGHKVASALVGTFLGILMCYGLFGPISSAMGKEQEAEGRYYGFLRMASLAFVADDGGGIGAPFDSPWCAAQLSGNRSDLPRRRSQEVAAGGPEDHDSRT